MKRFSKFMLCIMFAASYGYADNVYVDLSKQFDTDAFVSGSALGDPLNSDGNYLDPATLPEDFVYGQPYTTVDGLTAFLYGDLAGESSLDSLRINGQSLEIQEGQYDRLQLALLSTSGFLDLGRMITLNYTDGSSEDVALGPLAAWFNSPARYFDSYYSYTDQTGINEVLNLHLQQDDQDYIVESTGSSTEARDDYRFVDATSVLTYEFDLDSSITDLTMGIDMSNNFVVGISTTLDGNFVEVLNSQDMYGEDVHNGSNRRIYEVDLAPYLAEYADNIFQVRFTDGTTNNGWGPSIWNIYFYAGKVKTYEGEQATPLDLSNATVYADFRGNGGTEEAQYLLQDNGSSIYSDKHRFMDQTASVVYAFDLPDDVTDVKAAMLIDGDFSISATNDWTLIVPVDFIPGSTRDADYTYEDSSSNDAGTYRFCDGNHYIIYAFDMPSDIQEATLQMELENNFVVSVGSSVDNMEMVLNSQDMYGSDIHDASNHKTYEVELGKFLQNNSDHKIYVKFEDGSTGDGWGPAMRKIRIVSGTEPTYTPVLNTADAYTDTWYGYQSGNANKYLSIIDFSSFMQNNSSKELYVKFEDGTPETGYGPGIYRFVLFSGDIKSTIDGFCMNGLNVTGSEVSNIAPWGINLCRREFPVDSAKTLKSVTLPGMSDSQDVYLFAATLESGSTSVSDWSLF